MIARLGLTGIACLLGLAAARADGLTLSSPDLADGARFADEQVYDQLGCQGGNLSPALQWSGAPPGTASFALVMYDPDAPNEGGFWHWAVLNIPARASGLPKGAGDVTRDAAPPGATQAVNDFGSLGYGGPCPPDGDAPHHYHIALFALGAEKIEPLPADLAALAAKLRARALATSELVGVYGH